MSLGWKKLVVVFLILLLLVGCVVASLVWKVGRDNIIASVAVQPPTAIPAQPAQGTGAYIDGPNKVSLWVDPAGVWQIQEHYWLVSHASGVNTTITYTLHIPKGFVGVIEANKVDGKEGGFLLAYAGPDDVVVQVTNGIVGITKEEWALELFKERWGVLLKNKWDWNTVRPLSSWNWKP